MILYYILHLNRIWYLTAADSNVALTYCLECAMNPNPVLGNNNLSPSSEEILYGINSCWYLFVLGWFYEDRSFPDHLLYAQKCLLGALGAIFNLSLQCGWLASLPSCFIAFCCISIRQFRQEDSVVGFFCLCGFFCLVGFVIVVSKRDIQNPPALPAVRKTQVQRLKTNRFPICSTPGCCVSSSSPSQRQRHQTHFVFSAMWSARVFFIPWGFLGFFLFCCVWVCVCEWRVSFWDSCLAFI